MCGIWVYGILTVKYNTRESSSLLLIDFKTVIHHAIDPYNYSKGKKNTQSKNKLIIQTAFENALSLLRARFLNSFSNN